MTDGGFDWTPEFESTSEARFKWGQDGESGQFTIWEVGGPGDGFPGHDSYLTTAWGRPIRHGRDLLGMVFVEKSAVTIVAYSQAALPNELRKWVAVNYPDHPIWTPVT